MFMDYFKKREVADRVGKNTRISKIPYRSTGFPIMRYSIRAIFRPSY